MNPYRRALISVSDKTGVENLAKSLSELGIEILSTGGTAASLREAGIDVIDVSDVTGFPEIMDGRVKTLHPLIHGGLLGRRDIDASAMTEHGIEPIDLLIVNLYPFESTIAREDCTREEAVENIDIGGPAMIRAAAKNHAFVSVVVDPEDYGDIIAELTSSDGALSEETRRRLAAKAYGHTASYDAAIWGYLRESGEGSELPPNYPLALRKHSDLRYGENPHQRGALYRLPDARSGSVVNANQIQGKPLSYNNIADADAALECVNGIPGFTCVIVKHANPCGVGVADTALEAYEKAYRTDPTSAFGGIIALNTECNGALAKSIVERQFLEVIAAPTFTPEAINVFAGKPNIRVLETGIMLPIEPGLRMQQVQGGVLVQDKDLPPDDEIRIREVTKKSPTASELADAMLAWEVARFVKSNAIVFCKDKATVGIGAGQMSRVTSTRIAAMKAAEAGLETSGAVMASDAFFPFRDGIDVAAEYGIRVVIQPGGSMRDEEVIQAANEHDIAMLFTGIRHFRH